MYEDTIEKLTLIMNSRMNFNSTSTMQEIVSATIVSESLSAVKRDETLTININLTKQYKKEGNKVDFIFADYYF